MNKFAPARAQAKNNIRTNYVQTMKTLHLTKAALLLVLPSLVALANAAGIANSAHDWSTEAWNVNKDLCGPCHMAHGSDPANQLIPLWSHQTLNATWQP